DGGVCIDCSDLRVAGALHDCHRSQIAEQRSAAELITRLFRPVTVAVWATEIRLGIPAFVLARGRGAKCFRLPRAGRESSADNLRRRLWCPCRYFESSKGMTSNDRAGARAIDIHISRLQLS